MFLKTILIKPVIINIGEKTHVSIEDAIEFSVTIPPTNENVHIYHIQKIKGDFEIMEVRDSDDEIALPYDKIDNTFASNYHFHDGFVFHILANLEFQIINDNEEYHCLDDTYKLKVPKESLATLNPGECFKKCIIFDDFKETTLSCFIKKVDNENVEIHFDNPNQLGINGKTSDFRLQTPATDDFTAKFTFDYTPSKKQKLSYW